MRTEPRRPALGGEAEHEARLPGRGDELGAAALPLARGGDELPPNIGVSSKNCGDKVLEGGATPQGIGENILFHNRRPSPPAFALPRPPGAGGSARPPPRDVNTAKRRQSKPRGRWNDPRSGSFSCEWKSPSYKSALAVRFYSTIYRTETQRRRSL